MISAVILPPRNLFISIIPCTPSQLPTQPGLLKRQSCFAQAFSHSSILSFRIQSTTLILLFQRDPNAPPPKQRTEEEEEEYQLMKAKLAGLSLEM